MRGKCERGRGSVNVAAARANVIRREAADGFVGEGERRGGNINADGAGAEVFAGDGCSQGTSFVPMAAISRRWRGGRIYNNTRTRERQRRKCVKPADLTTHSPPKICSRPSTATRPARALPLPHAAPTHTRRLRDAFLADLTTHSPPKTVTRPRTATRPPRALPFPHAASTHTRRLHDARPPTSQHIPRRRSAPVPAQRRALPAHFRSLPAPTHARRQRDAFPADPTTHSPPKTVARPRSDTLPLLPFRFGHKKTAPHSACAMPNVSVDRRCGRSFGLVSRALFAAVAGRWRVGVGLRPQPWALRSRRCGRVLRA